MARSRVWRVIAALAVALLAGSWMAPAAGANGTPKEFPLYYHPDWSNWGPTSAQGVANVTPAEGLVMLTVQGMQVPDDGSHFEAWITSRAGGPWYSAGTFEVDAEGRGTLQGQVEEDINNPDVFDLLVITVEPPGNPHPGQPDPRHAIGGVFPVDKIKMVLPSELPKTGEKGGIGSLPAIAAAVCAVLIFVGPLVGFTLTRRWRGR